MALFSQSSTRGGARPGLVAHSAGLLGATAKYLRARLQLAGLEAKEAAVHYAILVALLMSALIIFVFGYLFLCLGLALGIAALIGGDHQFLWATLILAAAHLGAAVACVLVAKARLFTPMFSSTLDELRKDQEWLTTESKN